MEYKAPGVNHLEASSGSWSRIDRWRTYVLAYGGTEVHVAVIEGQLCDRAARLADACLDADGAFLVTLWCVAVGDKASNCSLAGGS